MVTQDIAGTVVVVVTVVSAAILAFVIWRHGRTMGRLERRLCAACGYDLRATPGRCPECGQDVVPPEAKLTGKLDLAALQREWPANPIAVRAPDEGESVVVLHETDHPTEAELLCQQLEARGVRAWPKERRRRVSLRGYTTVETATHHVLVYSGDAADADAYVRALRRCRLERDAAQAPSAGAVHEASFGS